MRESINASIIEETGYEEKNIRHLQSDKNTAENTIFYILNTTMHQSMHACILSH
jgi:hypothetical protein